MKVPFVDLHEQYLTIKSSVDEAIGDVIAKAAFARGLHVEWFEQAWADALGVDHCISCDNGTDALYIAMRGLGVGPGDEVITSAHSWISTSESITQAGARVVFCDTDYNTFTIDPDLIEAKITPRTVGIIPVHLFGQPCDMDPIMSIARKHCLWVIEDCAHSHLAKYKGRFVGTFGNAATFSFHPGNNLGAFGDAGCIITDDDDLAEWMATFARHGGGGEHIMEGINSRLDGLQAAILLAKLPYLDSWTESRRRLAARYNKLLQGVSDVKTPVAPPERDHVYHLYVIRANKRDELRKHLAKAEVSTALNYPRALPYCPAYAYLHHDHTDFPVAYADQFRVLSLPIYAEISEVMVCYVCDKVTEFFGLRPVTA
jgi:dTDP-4-amino-4,6-dideoxygalactose transaminase